jgi:sporulation protein YlmC with PRC-barrel domain
MIRHVRVELLLGRRVRDSQGRVVGRIESIHARWADKNCLVEEYHLGPGAALERFGISAARMVGLRLAPKPVRVPWDQLDLSDPENPRLRCSREELPV